MDSSNAGLAPAGHEFITFTGYGKGSTANRARFLVDPESERYRMLLHGHIASGRALAPVSLYIKLVTRAALMLHPDTNAHRTHASRMEGLQMRTLTRLDAGKYIVLHLATVPGLSP
ncbi:polyketide synthase [Aspergillus terreus]|uniref:Polyketide synthase n=1 Tax=Aspergillus terreus TaxID=33178 RepID=A0A5M3Z2B8_ASPTE|nr:hypothetical protein ATETN484_0008004800 [Aspergillus terreus]GFF16431.1 polyketide synthase [Aspergillus terreus]